MQILLFGTLSDTLTAIGTVLTDIWIWLASTFTGIENVLATSVILQILLGISAVFLVMALVKKVISVIKGFGKVK